MTNLAAPTARLVAPKGLPREQWLEVRRRGIGGSDVAAILGMDPNRGPLHVYLDKRGQPERRNPRLERAARRGHRLESLVAEFFCEETGHQVVDAPGTLQHAEHPWMLANCDYLVVEAGATPAPGGVAGPLECKTRTWRAAAREGWGGEEPPDGPALQAHWYLAVTGYQVAYVAGLVDDDLVWYRIKRDEELIEHLITVVGRFWHEHVLAGVPPEPGDLEDADELLGRLWDIKPDSIRVFSEAETAEIDLLLARRDAARNRIAELEREITSIENTLKAKLGPAEVALAPGRELYSYRPTGTFASRRFRDEQPDLAAKYTRLVETVDQRRLQAEHPDVYRRYRARVLRIPRGSR